MPPLTTHVFLRPPSLLSAFFDSVTVVNDGEVEAIVAVFDAGKVEAVVVFDACKVDAVVVFDAPRLLDDVDISWRTGPRNMSWYIRRRAIARSGPRAAR